MSTSTPTEPQEFSFQAEIKQLLNLLAHSIYQSKEIAVRELISNASDAIDKFRHVALSNSEFRDQASNLEIIVEGRPDSRDIAIIDNGIGMSRQDLVENLGTIAKSGSLEFVKALTQTQENTEGKPDVSLIGQFGVGFYSAFMLAEHVTVRTRSYQEEQGWEWRSDGSGTFEIRPINMIDRGTEVILHLKEDLRDLTGESKLKEVIRTYSRFIPHPIRVGGEIVNDQRPIWAEPKGQVSDEQHKLFYEHLAHRADEKPLWHLHLSVDSPIQFQSVLYCPQSNIERLGLGRVEHGINLLAKRVLVQDDCQDLLPDCFRFLVGLVDSEDLPLNVSRETLQDNTVIRRIRNVLTKSVINQISALESDDPETHASFLKEFDVFLKEGVVSDLENRDKLASLLQFASTIDPSGNQKTTIKEYINRAPDDQKVIYYLGGPDLATVLKSPNLEIFTKKRIEVLLLTEPVDEVAMANLNRFEGRDLKSIDAADIDLPGPEIETPESTANPDSAIGRVIGLFKEALGEKVVDVRESKRLTDSPCCLLNATGGLSTQMQRLLRQANREFPTLGRVFEINPSSPLIIRLGELSSNPSNADFIKLCGLQLWSNTLALEGAIEDPKEMVARIQGFMEVAAASKSSIIH